MSSTLLKDERISPEQFLDRILHINKKIDTLDENSCSSNDDASSPQTEDGENDSDVSCSGDDQRPNVPNGTCISCLERRCDIILLPCFEIVVCSQCWQDISAKHINECNEIYKNNKRKLATEKKKVLCPCCGKVVVETKEFRMATF